MTLWNALQASFLLLSFEALFEPAKRCTLKDHIGKLTDRGQKILQCIGIRMCFGVHLFAGTGLRNFHAKPVLQETGSKHSPEGHSGESFEHPLGREYFEQTFERYSGVIFELPFKFLLEIPSSDKAFK